MYTIKLPYDVKSLKDFENKKKKLNASTYVNILKKDPPSIIHLQKLNINKNSCCWWCTCSFNNDPYYLPNKYENKKYYVIGYFCNPKCVNSYNLYYLNDYQSLNRFTLTKNLYNCGNIALPKEQLDKFGGNLNIDIFRKY